MNKIVALLLIVDLLFVALLFRAGMKDKKLEGALAKLFLQF
jgi:hypothetical protein